MIDYEVNKLSPVEAYMLIRGNAARVKDICKYIIGNLFYMRVLSLESVTRSPHKSDPTQTYEYVVRGDRFEDYLPTKYEEFFLEPFRGNPEMRLLLWDFVKSGLENTNNKRKLVKAIVTSPALRELTNYNYFTYLFIGFATNDAARALTRRLVKMIDDTNDLLEKGVNNARTREIVKDLGSLSLLLLNPGNEFLLAIEKAVVHQLRKSTISSSSSGGVAGCSSCSGIKHDTDGSGCSSSSDSGCSSGCSGCGGGGD